MSVGDLTNMAEGASEKRKHENEKSKKDENPKKKFAGHWSQGLLSSMDDPELIVEKDDKMTIIKDKYPKV
jgi:aprataxin